MGSGFSPANGRESNPLTPLAENGWRSHRASRHKFYCSSQSVLCCLRGNKVDRPLGLVQRASYSHKHNRNLSKYEFGTASAAEAFVADTMWHAWAVSAQRHTKRRKRPGVSECGTAFRGFLKAFVLLSAAEPDEFTMIDRTVHSGGFNRRGLLKVDDSGFVLKLLRAVIMCLCSFF